MLKLSQFDSKSAHNQGGELHLKVKTEDGWTPAFLDFDAKEPKKPLILRLLGLESDKGSQLQINALREIRMSAEKEKRKGRKSDDFDIDLEKETQKLCRKLSKLTIGWENIPDENGKLLEFSEKAAYELYMGYNDIRVQASNFVADEINFINS